MERITHSEFFNSRSMSDYIDNSCQYMEGTIIVNHLGVDVYVTDFSNKCRKIPSTDWMPNCLTQTYTTTKQPLDRKLIISRYVYTSSGDLSKFVSCNTPERVQYAYSISDLYGNGVHDLETNLYIALNTNHTHPSCINNILDARAESMLAYNKSESSAPVRFVANDSTGSLDCLYTMYNGSVKKVEISNSTNMSDLVYVFSTTAADAFSDRILTIDTARILNGECKFTTGEDVSDEKETIYIGANKHRVFAAYTNDFNNNNLDKEFDNLKKSHKENEKKIQDECDQKIEKIKEKHEEELKKLRQDLDKANHIASYQDTIIAGRTKASSDDTKKIIASLTVIGLIIKVSSDILGRMLPKKGLHALSMFCLKMIF